MKTVLFYFCNIAAFWMILVGVAHCQTVPQNLPERLTAHDFISFDVKQAQLGQLLFYDKILSGNRNIACGTCHHHTLGSSDGLSLGIGEGGEGLGPKRTGGHGNDRIKKRIPRNSPGLWNLGAREIKTLFHDGRLSKSDLYGNGYNSPARQWLPDGLSNLLAAQALLPLTSQFEMAGNPKENEVAGAAHDRIDKVWPIITKRVRSIPAYSAKFLEAFPELKSSQDISIVHIGEALGAFIGFEWQSYDAPFDEYLSGNTAALNSDAKRGMELFFGKAKCASCHSGPLFADQEFYALALPPFGPGRTRQFDPAARDVGRMGESDRLEDAYRFRTPSLRNVTLTAPYGHNGAYPTLEGIISHHVDPLKALENWQRYMANLPELAWLAQIDFVSLEDQREMKRLTRHIDVDLQPLTKSEIDALVAFLHSLTGENAHIRPLGVPASVPSGITVE